MSKDSVIDTGDLYSRIVNQQLTPPNNFWYRMKLKWHGGRQLLPTTDSPTISTSTTSTNLLEFQSNSTINNFMRENRRENLKKNLRRTIPEIEPLQTKNEMSINTKDQDFEFADVQLYPNNEKKVLGPRHLLPQVIAAIAVSWVSMVIGYVSGYTSPAGTSMREDLKITEFQFSWISGIMPFAALFGGLCGGPLIECLGRKWTLLLTNILFLVGWTVNFFAEECALMYVSRVITGCGVGIASLTLPVYLGETIQPEVRGTLGLLPTAFGNIGILICFLMGIVFSWRGIAGIGALLSIPFLLLIWVIPDTPRWYVSKGKIEEARKALDWLRGQSNPDAVDKEFEAILKSQKESDEKSGGLDELLSKSNIKPLTIVLGLMFFQQLSGINAVIFYTTQIFRDTGSDIDPSLQTIIVGVVNFASTFIATILIDRMGRKALLSISSVAMTVTLVCLGAYFYLMHVAHVDVSSYGWVPLASFVIYVLGFSFGFGPIPWLMMGELLPSKIRGPAASVATGFNWTCTSIVTTTFPMLKDLIGACAVFWLFGAITAIALVFTICCVPETKGRSLEDIEKRFGVKVRRMSSVANLKPSPSTC